MKKILCLLLIICMIFCFTGCNYNLIDVKYDFNKAYIKWTNNDVEMVELTSWAEDDTTFTLNCKDGRIICSDQQNIILVKE